MGDKIDTEARTLAGRLRAALEARGMTQLELAEAVGHKSGAAVNTWVNGGRRPKPANIRAAAKALDVDPDWLRGDDGKLSFSEAILESAAEKTDLKDRAALTAVVEHLNEALDIAHRMGWQLEVHGTLAHLTFDSETPAATEARTGEKQKRTRRLPGKPEGRD